MIPSESGSIYPTTDVLHQAGPPSAPPPGRAFSTPPPPGRAFSTPPPPGRAFSTPPPPARLLHQLLQPWTPGRRSFSKGSRRHSFRGKVRTTEKEEEGGRSRGVVK
ncbi:unnamed protein product [Boreogadus saida]